MNYEIAKCEDGYYVLETQSDAPTIAVGGPYRSWSAARRAGRHLPGIRKLKKEN